MSDTASIRATDDGPLIVKGSFVVLDGDGNPYPIERTVVALCRCGHSASKPFCDGSHSRVGFRNRSRVASAPGARASDPGHRPCRS